MKLTICIFTILSPALGWAQLAGDWAGVIPTSPQHSLRIVLHVAGPDTALKATSDSPDQGRYNLAIPSITFSNSTLEFAIPTVDVKYSGVLNASGSIVGTFTQHGVGVPLVLERAAVTPTSTESPGVVTNGHYRDTASGVEFDLPSDWFLSRTDPDPANPAGVRVFSDSSGKAIVITAFMAKGEIPPENISKALERVIPHQLAMRAGQTEQGPLHEAPQYKIREGSLDQTFIGGHPAIRAIGEYSRGGKSFAELLAWIYTEHTRTYFMVRARAEDLPYLQAPFDQMLQSAKIP